MNENFSFQYHVFEDASELNPSDLALLEKAREATKNAYAPYSNFHVAAVALTSSGQFVTGTNQENASFPAGICAERTLLSTLSSILPDDSIQTLAVSYYNHNETGSHDRPISPCGICRQSLLEFEQRKGKPMRVIMSGQTGKVIILEKASQLLPFSFGVADLK
jgi:cytidine deaminase